MLKEDLEKKFNELEIQHASLSRETEKLYELLQLTPQAVNQFLNDPGCITAQEKTSLEKAHANLQARLQLEIENIRDIKQAKKSYESLNLPRHAIFCK